MKCISILHFQFNSWESLNLEGATQTTKIERRKENRHTQKIYIPAQKILWDRGRRGKKTFYLCPSMMISFSCFFFTCLLFFYIRFFTVMIWEIDLPLLFCVYLTLWKQGMGTFIFYLLFSPSSLLRKFSFGAVFKYICSQMSFFVVQWKKSFIWNS